MMFSLSPSKIPPYHTGSTILLQQPNTSTNIEIPQQSNNSSNNGPIPNSVVRDTSKMPMTNMTKIMRNILPSNVKIANDAKDMIQQSATKYITFVTTKAKERCQSEYRKVMNADDLLWAIESLGFHDYVGPLTTFLQRYRNLEGGDDLFTYHPEPTHFDNNGPPLDLEPNPIPVLKKPHLPLPSQDFSFGPDFSMDPNPNMQVFGPNDVNGFYLDGSGVGCSNDFFAHHGEPTPLIDNNGPTLLLEPNPLEKPHLPLPPPNLSSSSNFSMVSNTNMEMFDPNDVSSFYLDRSAVDCSNDDFTNFDPSIFINDQP